MTLSDPNTTPDPSSALALLLTPPANPCQVKEGFEQPYLDDGRRALRLALGLARTLILTPSLALARTLPPQPHPSAQP